MTRDKKSESTADAAAAAAKRQRGLNRSGRPPGAKNKVTVEFRETVRRLLEDNSANVAKWLQQVADGVAPTYDEQGNMLTPGRDPDPATALLRLGHLAEFAAPKLTRTEVTGEGGGPLQVTVNRLA